MKERLDILLVKKGLASSREKAKEMIKLGLVEVNGKKEMKASVAFENEALIKTMGNILPYVSRGGLKLEKAIQQFDLKLGGLNCLDIGASTGGFTDCMLQNGAARVFAVDVGCGQLNAKLQNDTRVVSMEKVNFRYMKPEDIAEPIHFASADVSFISLTMILEPAYGILQDKGEMVCLIKPQFEAGPQKVGKKGVVKNPAVHEEVIRKVMNCAFSMGFCIKGLSFSPITGPEGNIEYLLWLSKENAAMPEDYQRLIKTQVEAARGEFKA